MIVKDRILQWSFLPNDIMWGLCHSKYIKLLHFVIHLYIYIYIYSEVLSVLSSKNLALYLMSLGLKAVRKGRNSILSLTTLRSIRRVLKRINRIYFSLGQSFPLIHQATCTLTSPWLTRSSSRSSVCLFTALDWLNSPVRRSLPTLFSRLRRHWSAIGRVTSTLGFLSISIWVGSPCADKFTDKKKKKEQKCMYVHIMETKLRTTNIYVSTFTLLWKGIWYLATIHHTLVVTLTKESFPLNDAKSVQKCQGLSFVLRSWYIYHDFLFKNVSWFLYWKSSAFFKMFSKWSFKKILKVLFCEHW